MDDRYALFGILFAFGNRLQTAGDSFYNDITCKQFFLLICLNLFPNEAPTINDLAEVMGCSHQNVKQLALKLEKNGFLTLLTDQEDKRKLRIVQTKALLEFANQNKSREIAFMQHLFEGIPADEIAVTYKVMNTMETNLTKIKEMNL